MPKIFDVGYFLEDGTRVSMFTCPTEADARRAKTAIELQGLESDCYSYEEPEDFNPYAIGLKGSIGR